MDRLRNVALRLLAAALGVAGLALDAHAAAEIHRLSLVLSPSPSSISPSDFNNFIDQGVNLNLRNAGLEPLKEISFGWYYEAQLRYFIRPTLAINAGIGQIRSSNKREFLPGLEQDIQIRTEVFSAPVHLGAAYYLPPYNQGDFQARAYLGGGFLSLTDTHALLQLTGSGLDPETALRANGVFEGHGQGPGFYLESGVHMFFASRFSVMLGAIYRNAKVRTTSGSAQLLTGVVPLIQPFTIDTGGVGLRAGLAIGL